MSHPSFTTHDGAVASPGSAAAQIGLVAMYERYVSQERLANLFPSIECIWREADRRHDDMLRAALNCGYAPGREDSHLSTLAWVQRRVGLLERVMAAHVAEARRAA